MLLDVLIRFCVDTGLDTVQQRDTVINYLNAGQKEMYDRLECNKIYRETTLAIAPNKLVSLPSFIGELRGMRTSISEMPFELHSLSAPRYVNQTWSYKFKNWRDLGDFATLQNPALVGPLTISGTPETNPVTIYIAGQTANALRAEEQIVLDSTPKTTVNSYGPTINNIACLNPDRTSDITIQDANGNTLAVLYNIDSKTRYKIVDVSKIPWPLDTPDGQSYVDVLYKQPYRRFTKDSDQFPAGDDYDNAWYYASMWRYYQNIPNKTDLAATMKGEFLQALIDCKDQSERNIVKKLQFGPNKFFRIFKRRRNFPAAVTGIDYYQG